MRASVSSNSRANGTYPARELWYLVEPILGVVFYNDEAVHGGLGFTRVEWYVAGRAACLGDLLRRATDACSVAGFPMFAGVRSQPVPDDPLLAVFRECEAIREQRGDAHHNAWRAAGMDPVEIVVLTESWRNKARGSIARWQMGWSENDIVAAVHRLEARGYLRGAAITDGGIRCREAIELTTDAQQAQLVDALGDNLSRVRQLLASTSNNAVARAANYWEE